MAEFAVSLLGGIASGGAFALIALGFVLAFRATGTMNFALGQLLLFPAYVTASLEGHGVNFTVAFLIATFSTAAICALFYLSILQRLIGEGLFLGFIATLGLASVLDGLMDLVFKSATLNLSIPGMPTGASDILSARIPNNVIVFAIATTIIALCLTVSLRFSDIGIRVRAAGQNAVLASQGGINVRAVYIWSWALVGVLAAFAGIVFGSIQLVSPNLESLGLAVFPAALLGGLDSIEGALVGGMVVGILQAFVQGYIGGQYVDVITYGMLLVVLLFIPQGLFGSRRVARV